MSDNNTILPDAPVAPVEEAKVAEPVLDEVEQSAMFISQSHKTFRKLVYALAKRKKLAPVRVLEAVLFEPLEQIKLSGKEEEQLFDLCQAVMYHKGKVLNYAFERAGEKLKKQGEETNGEK